MRHADWTITEAVYAGQRPSSKWEDDDDEDLTQLYHQLRLLRAAGCPPDTEKGNPQIQKWKKYRPKGFATALQIYVLKTKPARWRVYFYVVPPSSKRQIEILHVVEKKQQKRNPADLTRCKFVLDRIVEDTAECVHVFIPETR